MKFLGGFVALAVFAFWIGAMCMVKDSEYQHQYEKVQLTEEWRQALHDYTETCNALGGFPHDFNDGRGPKPDFKCVREIK